MMHRIWLGGISLWALVVLASCSGCYEPPNYYAEAAFHRQRELRARADTFEEIDEFNESAMLLDLDKKERREWQRRAYETVDEWLSRIEALLYAQRDIVAGLRTDILSAEAREKELVERVQRYRSSNQSLRAQISRPNTKTNTKIAGLSSKEQKVDLAPPPFSLHLVKQGETLYSIAMQYYGEGAKFHDIMQWNQGWIRYPERILAGLPLILFPEGAEDTSNHVVEHYINELEKRQGARG